MKTLVVFYSRTGNTKKLAEFIAKELKADVDEICDEKDRRRKIVGWCIAGKDAMKKNLTKIKYKKNPREYDLVVLGTPIWVGTMTPAIRTYLKENKLKKVGFFCTCGSDSGKCFSEMQNLSKKPLAVFECKDKELEDSWGKVREFCKKLRNI